MSQAVDDFECIHTDIDASLTFGFYVKDQADLMDLADSLQKSNTSMKGYPAISVAEQRRGGGGGGEGGGGGGGGGCAVGAAGVVDEEEDEDGFSLI